MSIWYTTTSFVDQGKYRSVDDEDTALKYQIVQYSPTVWVMQPWCTIGSIGSTADQA